MPEETFNPDLFDSANEQKETTDIFNKAVDAPPGPIGTLQVLIKSGVLERSISSNRRQVHWELEVLMGPEKGEIINKYDGIDTEVGARIFGQNLKRLGVATGSITLDKLPAILLSLKDKKAVVTAKVKGEYYNVNFTKLLPGKAVQAGGAGKGVKKTF